VTPVFPDLLVWWPAVFDTRIPLALGLWSLATWRRSLAGQAFLQSVPGPRPDVVWLLPAGPVLPRVLLRQVGLFSVSAAPGAYRPARRCVLVVARSGVSREDDARFVLGRLTDATWGDFAASPRRGPLRRLLLTQRHNQDPLAGPYHRRRMRAVVLLGPPGTAAIPRWIAPSGGLSTGPWRANGPISGWTRPM
jgi:hypothetical protein